MFTSLNTSATTTSNGWFNPLTGTWTSNVVAASYFTATSTTATSTFANGLNLTGGCFEINGACFTGGTGTNYFSNSGAITTLNTGSQLAVPTNGWFSEGTQLLAYASSTNSDTIFGLGAGGQNATTSAMIGNNSAFGLNALHSNTTGSNNTAQGLNALFSNTTGSDNTAQGLSALYSNTTASYNAAFGRTALSSNTTGSYNTANGMYSLYFNTTGTDNTANGYQSLYSNTTGAYNTANGYQSLYSNTTGAYNTANGYQSLYSNTTGAYNTAFGYYAGRYQADGTTALTTTSNSVYLGAGTRGFDNNDNNSIVIGYNAIGLGANTAVLGNSGITKTVLQGSVGIGTTSPWSTLSVNGTSDLGTNALAGSFTATSTTATSTFANGLNLTGGCLEIGGACFTGGGTNYWTASGSNIYNNNAGNVGIGTAAPFATLAVEGAQINSANKFNTTLLDSAAVAIDIGGGVGFGGNYTGTTPTLWAGISGLKEDATDGNYGGYLAFATRPNGNAMSEKMRITSGGNVGIGNTSPTYKLTVNGTIFNYSAANNISVAIGSNSGYGYIQANQSAGTTVQPLYLNPSGSSVLTSNNTLDDGSGNMSGNTIVANIFQGTNDNNIVLNDGFGNTVMSGNHGSGITFPENITITPAASHTNDITCYLSDGKLGYMTQTELLTGGGSATCHSF
jgi:hypothetical protein